LPTVLRVGSLRFVIWLNDHAPPHVHVFSGDAEASIELRGPAEYPRLVLNQRMKRSDLAVALRASLEHQAFLLGRWTDIHG
jgi:hypothetical protein